MPPATEFHGLEVSEQLRFQINEVAQQIYIRECIRNPNQNTRVSSFNRGGAHLQLNDFGLW